VSESHHTGRDFQGHRVVYFVRITRFSWKSIC